MSDHDPIVKMHIRPSNIDELYYKYHTEIKTMLDRYKVPQDAAPTSEEKWGTVDSFMMKLREGLINCTAIIQSLDEKGVVAVEEEEV